MSAWTDARDRAVSQLIPIGVTLLVQLITVLLNRLVAWERRAVDRRTDR